MFTFTLPYLDVMRLVETLHCILSVQWYNMSTRRRLEPFNHLYVRHRKQFIQLNQGLLV